MIFEITYGNGRVLLGAWEDLPDDDVQIVRLHQRDRTFLRVCGSSRYFLAGDVFGTYSIYEVPNFNAWRIIDGIASKKVHLDAIPKGAHIKKGEWVTDTQARAIGLILDDGSTISPRCVPNRFRD